jgi:hypothetical protein
MFFGWLPAVVLIRAVLTDDPPGPRPAYVDDGCDPSWDPATRQFSQCP